MLLLASYLCLIKTNKISSPFCAVSEPQCLFINKEFTNHDCDADDNFDKKKMNLYFTYESRDTLKSFTLFITVKTIVKLSPEHIDKFEIKFKKLDVVVYVRQITQNLVITCCCFAEDDKEMYKEL